MKLPVITGNYLKNTLNGTLLALASINPGQACPVANKHIEIAINGHTLTVEVAGDLESHMCGLAFRDDLPADHGMLFAYAEDQIIGFWMKDTFIPLSIAFLDANGSILEIHDMKPNDSTLRYISSVPARYALEVNQGWFDTNDVAIGDRTNFDSDAIAQVFLYRSASD